MKKSILFAIIAALLLQGCAILSESGPVTKRIAFKYATYKILGGDVERASKLVKWIGEARTLLKGDTSVSISLLDTELRKRIEWDKLKPEDSLLIDAIIIETKQRLIEDVGDSLLTPEQEVKLSLVLDWIEGAASELSAN